MNEVGSERSAPWSIYSRSDPSPSQAGANQEAPWKNFGTSMNAISFGFVATAILISMFLIMAIFEHLFRPTPDPLSSPDNDVIDDSPESGSLRKFVNPQTVSTTYAADLSVLMPGQQYPTFIAKPAPLPCKREGIYWPTHQQYHNFAFP